MRRRSVEFVRTLLGQLWRSAVTRILVIDDDRVVALSVAAMLEYEEFDVSIAGDGSAGIEAIEAAAFDLVIVDLFMPGMDGFDTIRWIRARDPMVPIIAITGFMARGVCASEGNILAKALELGATVSMAKPFKRPEIVRAVIACLEAASVPKSTWEKADSALV
jgi:CheY-like chemotaxis protein